MLSYPPLLKWAVDNGARVVNFEQCQTGLAAQKTTQLLATPDALEAMQREFGHLRCRDASVSLSRFVCLCDGARTAAFTYEGVIIPLSGCQRMVVIQ